MYPTNNTPNSLFPKLTLPIASEKKVSEDVNHIIRLPPPGGTIDQRDEGAQEEGERGRIMPPICVFCHTNPEKSHSSEK